MPPTIPSIISSSLVDIPEEILSQQAALVRARSARSARLGQITESIRSLSRAHIEFRSLHCNARGRLGCPQHLSVKLISKILNVLIPSRWYLGPDATVVCFRCLLRK